MFKKFIQDLKCATRFGLIGHLRWEIYYKNVLQTINTAAAWFIQICNCMTGILTVSNMIPEGHQESRGL